MGGRAKVKRGRDRVMEQGATDRENGDVRAGRSGGTPRLLCCPALRAWKAERAPVVGSFTPSSTPEFLWSKLNRIVLEFPLHSYTRDF